MLIEIATDKKMLCKSLPSIWKADFFAYQPVRVRLR